MIIDMAHFDASFTAYGLLFLFSHTMIDHINHADLYIITLYDTLYYEILEYIALALFRMLIILGTGKPSEYC